MSNISVHSTKVVRDTDDITSKVQYLRVSYGRFGNSKKVKSDILNTHADKQMLNVNKKLLQSPELEAIRQHDNALRIWLEKKCVPFPGWPGVLILPPAFTTLVWDRLVTHREDRHVLIAAFVKVYPQLKSEAEVSLKEEFDSSDYPTVGEVVHRFKFEWILRSFDTPESLKQISEAIFTATKETAKKQYTSAMEEVAGVMRLKLYEMVEHLKEKLAPTPDGEKKKQLRPSTVENLSEFLSDFPFRDVSNDTQLADVVAKVKALIGDSDAAAIRTSDEFKAKVFAGLTDITVTLGGLVEEIPVRKFRLDD